MLSFQDVSAVVGGSVEEEEEEEEEGLAGCPGDRGVCSVILQAPIQINWPSSSHRPSSVIICEVTEVTLPSSS